MESKDRDIEMCIARYLAGEASSDDTVKIAEWFIEDDDNRAAFRSYKAYWNAKVEHGFVAPLDMEASYKRIMAQIDNSGRKKMGGSRKWWIYVAAALVVGILGATLFSMMFTQSTTKFEEIHRYSYMSGKSVMPILLPDGTEVSLNTNSVLTYNNRYGKNLREVELKGEAYFCVVRNEESEFVVSLGDNRIVVLGTSFNLRYNNDAITATLMEGAIRFEAPDQTIVLKPNQQLVYNKFDGTLGIHNVDVEIISAWKDNLLKYKSIPFTSFLKLLEKQYDVEIVIADEALGACQVSGTFDVSLSLEQILEMINKSLSCKWKKNGNRYEITR